MTGKGQKGTFRKDTKLYVLIMAVTTVMLTLTKIH